MEKVNGKYVPDENEGEIKALVKTTESTDHHWIHMQNKKQNNNDNDNNETHSSWSFLAIQQIR